MYRHVNATFIRRCHCIRRSRKDCLSIWVSVWNKLWEIHFVFVFIYSIHLFHSDSNSICFRLQTISTLSQCFNRVFVTKLWTLGKQIRRNVIYTITATAKQDVCCAFHSVQKKIIKLYKIFVSKSCFQIKMNAILLSVSLNCCQCADFIVAYFSIFQRLIEWNTIWNHSFLWKKKLI